MREKLARYHGNIVDCAFKGWNDAWLDPGFVDWNIEEYLPKISLPILALQGADDQYGTIKQLNCLENKAAGDVTTHLLDYCAHNPAEA